MYCNSNPTQTIHLIIFSWCVCFIFISGCREQDRLYRSVMLWPSVSLSVIAYITFRCYWISGFRFDALDLLSFPMFPFFPMIIYFLFSVGRLFALRRVIQREKSENNQTSFACFPDYLVKNSAIQRTRFPFPIGKEFTSLINELIHMYWWKC